MTETLTGMSWSSSIFQKLGGKMSRKIEYTSFRDLLCKGSSDPRPEVVTEFEQALHFNTQELYTFLASQELSSDPLVSFLQDIKGRKEEILNHIMGLPSDKRLAIANKIVQFKDSWSALGAFFWLKRGRFEPSLNAGTLKSFASLLPKKGYFFKYTASKSLDLDDDKLVMSQTPLGAPK